MSSRFSANDFVHLYSISTQSLARIPRCPRDFQTVFAESASLQLVLKEVQEAVNDNEPNRSKKSDLSKMIDGYNAVLQELHGLLNNKYNSPGTQSRRTGDRMR